MKNPETDIDCQISDYSNLSIGKAEMPPQSIGRIIRLALRKNLGPKKVRKTKMLINDFIENHIKFKCKNENDKQNIINNPIINLKAGDLVRVRSIQEIESTLDSFQELKGCGFMPEMIQFCGTIQRVLKPVERFVDERTLKTHRAKGIVILDNLTCRGSSDLGRCDRNCYFFWREEWLEKQDSHK
jgi:hypothetical protein